MKTLTSNQKAGTVFLLLLTFAIGLYFPVQAWKQNLSLRTNDAPYFSVNDLKANQRKTAQFDEKMHIISAADDLKIDAIIDKT